MKTKQDLAKHIFRTLNKRVNVRNIELVKELEIFIAHFGEDGGPIYDIRFDAATLEQLSGGY